MNLHDLESAPKLFCENIKMGHSKEFFVMALSSGSEIESYALTPEHTKRLLKYITHEVERYEKEYGEIQADWNPSIVSPVQKLNPPIEGS